MKTSTQCVVPLLGYCDAAEGVWEADPRRDEGQSHDGVRNVEGGSDDGDHPDHHVGQRAHPDDRQEEGGYGKLGQLGLPTV